MNNRLYITAFLCLCLASGYGDKINVSASTSIYYPESNNYETSAKDDFLTADPEKVEDFSYGDKSIGCLSISGEIENKAKFDDIISYETTGKVEFMYSYNSENYKGITKRWTISSSASNSIDGYSIDSKIKKGAILIQKSPDRKNWSQAKLKTDVFANGDINESIYTVSDSEYKKGTYFRIYIAYTLKNSKGTEKNFIEKYEYYVCNKDDSVLLKDITTGQRLKDGDTIKAGFILDLSKSSDDVKVKKDGKPVEVKGKSLTFTEKGDYTVSVTTQINKTFGYIISVSDGLDNSYYLKPSVYEGAKKQSYTETNKLEGKTVFGLDSLTELYVGQTSEKSFVKGKVNSFDACGLTGDYAGIYLKLADIDVLKNSSWEVDGDDWGKEKNQNIAGVDTGYIGTGALIVQTSTDGVNWKNADKGRYENGLSNTDVYNSYNNKGDILIYKPDGEEITSGIFVRVYFAYRVKNTSPKEKETARYLESYQFYLCNENLDAVTFHNLTLKNVNNDIDPDNENINVKSVHYAETLINGSGTVTGFEIDKSANKLVDITVSKDGNILKIPETNQFTSTGKYTIHLESKLEQKKDITLFVDNQSDKEFLKTYFGEGFISGKRVYDEKSKYPAYVTDSVKYFVNDLDDQFLPISGYIKNLSTGETINITKTRLGDSGKFKASGTYEAEFTTFPFDGTSVKSGDKKTVRFNFKLVDTAPGPVKNKQTLDDYSRKSMADSYPIYYGAQYQSAAKGYITFAFSDWDSAYNYVYEYENGLVENLGNDKYRYYGEIYNSNIELMDVINQKAKDNIKRYYFDISDNSTYQTLEEDTIKQNTNLRELSLDRSVIIFADNEKEKMTNLDALPILNYKPFDYIIPGDSGKINSGFESYKFVKDKYGYDSDKIKITDSKGKSIDVKYDTDIVKQLEAGGIATGKLMISEETVYGDTTSYEAVYFSGNDNTTELIIECYNAAETNPEKVSVTMNNIHSIETDAFKISDITDKLDPYSLVIVSKDDKQWMYCAKEYNSDFWVEPGKYSVKSVNRAGNYYEFNITVRESDYATISFEGEFTEDSGNILTKIGDTNVELPDINRPGYILDGYQNNKGKRYEKVIDKIDFTGNMILTPIWKAVKVNLIFKNEKGEVIKTDTADYDSEYLAENLVVEDGYIFNGWIMNDELVTNNHLKVNSVSDIILYADVVEDENYIAPVIAPKNSVESLILKISAGAAAFVAVLVSITISKKKKKKFQPVEKIESGDDNEE